jgi:iron-sulfur cluster assembly accessory protein
MLNVTESAKSQLTDYLDEENRYLRVFVEGGGCSGMQYGFDLEDNIGEDDFEIPMENFSILIDSKSLLVFGFIYIIRKNHTGGHKVAPYRRIIIFISNFKCSFYIKFHIIKQ